jgi:hypothetical protein
MKSLLFTYIKGLFFAVIIFSCLNSYAQDVKIDIKYDTIKTSKSRTVRIVRVRTVPKFLIQLSGAYNLGALELSGHNGGFSRLDFVRGRTYGARNGYGVSIIGKIPLHKKGNFWLDIVTGFNRFQSDLIADNTIDGKVYYNAFSGGIGVDYCFTPADRVKYFIGLNTLASVISGKVSLPYDITVYDPIRYQDVKINSAFRLGYSVFAGIEYAFEKNVGFNAGFKFTHANLLLKKTTVPTNDTETELNDDGADPPVLYGGWKQFAYSSVFAGVSFYFGVKERRYKLP